MCGVVAVALADALPPRALSSLVSAGVAALAHRGPDGRGGWSSPDLVQRFGVGPFGALVDRLGVPRLRTASSLHTGAAIWIRTALAQYILRTLGDGMEMAHGIEGRVPFLDHHIVEVAFSISPAVLDALTTSGAEPQAWEAALMLVLSAAIPEARYRT
jgi:asparagine synthetase B (glutamine-hydrolysing)